MRKQHKRKREKSIRSDVVDLPIPLSKRFKIQEKEGKQLSVNEQISPVTWDMLPNDIWKSHIIPSVPPEKCLFLSKEFCKITESVHGMMELCESNECFKIFRDDYLYIFVSTIKLKKLEEIGCNMLPNLQTTKGDNFLVCSTFLFDNVKLKEYMNEMNSYINYIKKKKQITNNTFFAHPEYKGDLSTIKEMKKGKKTRIIYKGFYTFAVFDSSLDSYLIWITLDMKSNYTHNKPWEKWKIFMNKNGLYTFRCFAGYYEDKHCYRIDPLRNRQLTKKECIEMADSIDALVNKAHHVKNKNASKPWFNERVENVLTISLCWYRWWSFSKQDRELIKKRADTYGPFLLYFTGGWCENCCKNIFLLPSIDTIYVRCPYCYRESNSKVINSKLLETNEAAKSFIFTHVQKPNDQ